MQPTGNSFSRIGRKGFFHFPPNYENAIIKIMSEILADDYPEKTAIITSRPLSWLKFSEKQPSYILDLGKLMGMPGVKISADADSSGAQRDTLKIMSRAIECSQIEDLVKEIQNPKISAMISDHSILMGGRSHISNEIKKNLTDEFSGMRRLEETAAITTLGLQNANIEKVVSLVPYSVLASAAHAHYRQEMLKNYNLRVVIELPTGTIFQLAGIKTAILYFEKTKKQKESEILFISLNERGDLLGIESQTWFKGMLNWLAGKPQHTGFLADIPTEGLWHSGPYSPKLKEAETLIRGIGETVQLGDLCEIVAGLRYPRTPAKGKAGFPIIRGRDLSNPNINLNELERFKIEDKIRDRFKIRPDDILIQGIGDKPSTVVATEALKDAVAGDTVIILRPKRPDVTSEFIAQFLNSSAAQMIIKARQSGSVIPNVSISALREMPVPILPAEITTSMDDMAKMEQQLFDQAEKLKSMRLGLFNVKNREEFEQQLQALRTQVQSLSSSVDKAEDIEFQIKNFYPFPLAYPYRLLESIINPSERYMSQLRMAENILAFLGSISMAILESENQKVNVDLKKFWRGGISPGTWEHICTQSVKNLKKIKDEHFTSSLCSLWKRGKRDTQFTLTIKELIKKINDFKHHRGPKIEEEFQAASEEIEQKLKDCMAALAFFIQYPIRLVSDLNGVRGTTNVILHTLSYKGDHPGLSQEKLEFPHPLPKDTLYIEISPDNWAPLYPFITVQYCPLCQIRETYFIDRWQGTNKPGGLKSFERGHPVDQDEIGKELEKYQQAQTE